MTFAGYEGFGDKVLCVAKGRRAYEAVRNTLPVWLRIGALTTNVTDTTCEYVVTAEVKLTKAQMSHFEAFCAGVLAGVKYYS